MKKIVGATGKLGKFMIEALHEEELVGVWVLYFFTKVEKASA
jgi:aspartate-semialdehyde dehydrogenase